MKCKLLSLLLFLCYSFLAFGQETTSEIQGIVKNGKTVVPGATIKATHLPTGTSYSVTSRSDGRYNLSNLKIGGPYLITITNVGYKEQQKENIFLTLGQAYNADFSLNTEAIELTNVVVTGNRQQSKVFNNSRTGSAAAGVSPVESRPGVLARAAARPRLGS